MAAIPWLNYHHLYYFYEIVRHGGVNKAAVDLRLSQSTLSAQLKLLEESLGTNLFEREGKRLVLTGAGRVALTYAEEIFRAGNDLRAHFGEETAQAPRTVRMGALSPLSKNLQFELIRPLILEGSCQVQVVESDFSNLIDRLRSHQIDLLVTNVLPAGVGRDEEAHLLGEMPMYLVGRPPFKIPKTKFPNWIREVPLFLPTSQTFARAGFDGLMTRAGIDPVIRAEVDDMALLRLLALSGGGLALVPEIGVKFDLQEKNYCGSKKSRASKSGFIS